MSIDICQELHQNFIDFAYEANSQRAFPDARDGLKPGQRAALWLMFNKGYTSNKPHVKSAKISGAIIGELWPHGDQAMYETFARMSQPWINNIPEVDWHGSNGNQIVSAEAASSRYTEARLSKAAEEGMFKGIKKNNVPMIPNFSEDQMWPEVLPAVLPRLLVNGSQGIGVTVANHWTLFNLRETADLIIKYIETGNLDYDNFYPDFPSGGIIINKKDIKTIHATGKGKVVLRGKAEIKGNNIYITELPYQVYVEPLIDKIKTLVAQEQIKGIQNIYNKSDKKSLSIEIECSESPKGILNGLYRLTDLQKSYSPNQYALVGKTPKLLTLKDYIDIYIKHNESCIRKEYEFDLKKSEARKEVVDGLLKALEDIDNIINLIKQSASSADAKQNLIKKYGFSDPQATAIISMRLGTLAHLESVELEKERAELIKAIENCKMVVNSVEKQSEILVARLSDLAQKYGNPRRTEVIQIDTSKKEEEAAYVAPEECVVILTEGGTIKRVPSKSYHVQKRGGKGVKTQEDIISSVIRTNTVDQLMVFTNAGTMYRLSVNDVPEGTNASKGVSVKSLVQMETTEEPVLIYSIYKDTTAKYVVFLTKNGTIKKTPLEDYVNTKKKTGLSAIKLREGDSIASVTLASDEEIFVISKLGMVIRYSLTEVSASSRATIGIKGINLAKDDEALTLLPIRDTQDELVIITGSGLGKRVKFTEIPKTSRGGKGVSISKESSGVAAALLANDKDKLLVVGLTSSICIEGKDLPVCSRAAGGNVVIKSKVKSASKV